MASIVYPEWTGADPASSAWNTVILGNVQLVGICEIDEVPCAIRVDTKHAKKADKPTSEDLGIEQSKFIINQWINTSMWPAAQLAIAQLNPRRPGHERSPVQIVNPQVNVTGIQNVRITKLIVKKPTARGGMRILWHIEEWFDKPVAVKEKKKPIEAIIEANAANLGNTHPEVLLDEARRAALRTSRRDRDADMQDEQLDPNTGKPLSPTDPGNLGPTMFIGNPNVDAFPPLGT
jgi:hypothetical protein